MKKQPLIRLLSLVFASTLTFVSSAQTGYIVCDLSTGVVNGTTTPISYGSNDDTWQLALPASPNTYGTPVVCSAPPAWAVNGCGRWITNKLSLGTTDPHTNAAGGNYQYKTTFNMSHHCIPWAKMTLSYVGGDNMLVGLIINNTAYSITPGSTNDYNPLAQNIVININPNDIVLNQNVITFIVQNSTAGITGFFACGNISIGYCPMPGSGSTGIDETGAANNELFAISPNPGTGHFSFVMKKPADGKVEILDMVGRKVQSFNTNAALSNYSIDLSSSPKGIYTLIIRTGEIVETRRLVLQ